MNKLFRKYNQNRQAIWAVIIIIAFFVILLHTIFALIRNNRDKELQELIEQANQTVQNTQINQPNIESVINSNGIESNNNQSSSIINNYTNQIEKVINQFVEYCNNNQIEEAYNMVTQDCKQVLFPTINDFTQNYVHKIFTSNKSAKIEESMYGGSIYKVTYTSNLLSSGGYNKDETVQDYIKIQDDENDYKLSLNKFLYLESINKEKSENSIYVKAIQKQVYIDFEIYQIQVTNKTNNTILFSTKEDNNTIYLTDENYVEYPCSNIDSLDVERLLIEPEETTILNIQFSKMYNQERKIRTISFLDIVMDYDKYQNGQEVEKIGVNIQL